MRKREDLLKALEESEKVVLELREKEAPTKEDVTAVNVACDDIDTITAELEADERSERALADIRKPQVQKPKQPK